MSYPYLYVLLRAISIIKILTKLMFFKQVENFDGEHGRHTIDIPIFEKSDFHKITADPQSAIQES